MRCQSTPSVAYDLTQRASLRANRARPLALASGQYCSCYCRRAHDHTRMHVGRRRDEAAARCVCSPWDASQLRPSSVTAVTALYQTATPTVFTDRNEAYPPQLSQLQSPQSSSARPWGPP